MTDATDFIGQLKTIAGPKGVLTSKRSTERYRKGFRSGQGSAEAVVLPTTMLQLWRVLELCVAHERIVIMQAANTGLTEGSTPKGDYDRPVVIINTLKLDKLHIIRNGEQAVSLPGGTLYDLEKKLKPFGRQPHSVIGSSCIGASVVGGVCNNSGGSLVQRGPSYTEMSLYAQVTTDGKLQLVNHLGIDLGESPEEILRRLEAGDFATDGIHDTGKGSASDYGSRVRDVDAPSPSRYNADPTRLHESAGCAGKLAVLAVRLDTFPEDTGAKVFYIGTNNTADLTTIRRRILREASELPVSGEYLHRECFDISHRYGKDTLLMIHWLGTDYLPLFFSLKGQIDARLNKLPFLPKNLLDRLMQGLSRLVPEALPKRMLQFRDRFEHHLILKMPAESADEAQAILQETLGDDGWFVCDQKETAKAMLHRFAAAGAAIRYQAIHDKEVEEILALDIALRRNDEQWLETLPPDIEAQLVHKLYYAHFFCHVFHQDYIVRKGVDVAALKARMLSLLDQRGAEYPAEHNVGHLYEAKPALREFYETLDPTNTFNPGIGKTSRKRCYH